MELLTAEFEGANRIASNSLEDCVSISSLTPAAGFHQQGGKVNWAVGTPCLETRGGI